MQQSKHDGTQSAELFSRARAVIPDGISRSTIAAVPYPRYLAEARGAWVTDVDGNRMLDTNNNYTSIILGHADPTISAAVAEQLAKGTAASFATAAEIELAELLCDRVDSIDQVRFSNSGTEAVMMAIKAARAYTGRPGIIKIEGSYHGTYDHAEASLDPDPQRWGRPERPATIPYSAGAPDSVGVEVGVIAFNDPAAARTAITERADTCAAVLLDPMPNRVGLPEIDPEFVAAIEESCRAIGALLILDEVVTFRLAPGGAQQRFGIEPDLTALAKVIGGGFPVGALGGTHEAMSVFRSEGSPRARLVTGGTFTANPITMTAGLTAMAQLDEPAFARLEELGDRCRAGLAEVFATAPGPWQVTGAGSLFRIHPNQRHIRAWRDTRYSSDEATRMSDLAAGLRDREVFLTGYGLGCWNLATTDADIDHFVNAVAETITT